MEERTAVFLSRPVDSVSLLGRPLVVPCSVYDTQTHQQLPVHWLKDTGDLDTWVHQLANGSLFFPSLREEDLGTYTCQASDGLSLINATVSISKAYLDGMFHSPMSQTVRAGDSVFFQCVSGDSLPPAQISWQKEGQLFTKGGQIQGEYGGGNYKKISGTLHIPAVSKEDEGKYVCVTYNSVLGVHLYSEPASLTVEVLPSRLVISQGPENLTVPLETEAVLHCSVQGFPFPVVQWYKNNQPLENRTHLRLEDQGQLLVFKNVSVEDEGSYYCEAQNGVDTVTSQAAYLLPAVMGWGFGQQPTNVTARRGSSITLTCRPPHSRPPASITWFKNNRVLNKMPHFMFQESGDLFFQRVQETDRGIYFCRASNPYVFRAVSSVKVHLNVLVPPNITISPETMTATLGSRVFFQCQASGSPSPSIVWYKQGQTIKTGGKITVGSQNITLYISAVRAYDEGTYTCEATNALGQSRLSATLRVAVPPIIISFIKEINCSEGSSVVLVCEAAGDLPIKYSWNKEGNKTSISSPRMHINEHGALSIENVSRADGGVYHCTAENRAGREQRTATLTVTVENIQPKDENQDPEKVSRDRNTTNTPTEDPADIRSQNPVVKSATKAKLLGPVRELHGNTAWDHLELSWQPPFMDHGAPGAYKISYSTVQTIPTPAVSALSAEVEEKGMLEPDKKRPRGRNTQLLDHSSPGPTVFSITKQNGVLRTTDTRVTIWGLLPNQTYLISVLPYTAEGQEGVPLEKMLKTVPLGRLPSATEVSFHTSQKTHPPSLTSPSSEIPNSSVGSVLLSKLASSSQTVSLKSHEFAFSTPFTVPFPTSQPTTSPEVIAPSSVENFTSEDTSPRDSIAGSRELEARPSLTVSHTDPYLPLTVRVTTAPSETTELSPSQAAKSSKTGKAELTEWPKENTSQSPMRTSDNDMARDPKQTSWVPVLEKHDIPIVVGVGISLTLIFITMGFYSLVQKNEAGEAETGRGLLRDSGASSRNSSKPETGRTYENRAFEDDNSVAVIEQSPYTSASRSSQPATNTITVMAELSPEGQQEDLETILEINTESEQSVLLQSSTERAAHGEKSPPCPHPDIKLQNMDGWSSTLSGSGQVLADDSHVGGKHRQCQEAEPLPLPRPTSREEEGVHASLTLQASEPSTGSTTPIRHSVNISHCPAPLVLSHCVSLSDRGGTGITTVAVDVHLYTATSTPSPLLTTATGSSPGPQPAHSHSPCPEYDPTAPTLHYVQRTCL